MKLFKQILIILVVFLKTGNLLSENNLFNVNNILLEKKENTSYKQLTNQAIKEAFNELVNKILMKEDISKVSDSSLSKVKELVAYYNISKNNMPESNKVNFSVTFDKIKLHDYFYEKGLSYSDIEDKELFILPILLKGNEIFIFSNNYFYENWKMNDKKKLIEFILPLENIEIIQKINASRDNLINLKLTNLFKEYLDKNIAIALIENNDTSIQKIYLKTKIQGKLISKNLFLNKNNLEEENLNKKIIYEIKDELTNLVKSRNLIDIRTPSFLNVKLFLNKKSNLVSFNSKIKNINLIENVFIQEITKNHVKIKIKYLGNLDKIIDQLKKENIKLESKDEQWFIKIF